ncbi:MAG: MBOAT family protein [Bacteroidales bacterium]|jgi:D-alanyl-lipoteichoic acid acyltransferase DltB (MBOAT superfamily)|nr:MBOAT family protein [Bacteroidales bacterium]
MLFNSIEFAVFLPIVFCVYWLIAKKNINIQNGFIVLASYFFYACWDWRFLFLILFSTATDYTIGLLLNQTSAARKRKILLAISILVNLFFLGFFKYCNFFIENFVDVFRLFGKELNIHTLNIILPVGISFYTFQTMSYTIDVYRKKIEATKDFTAFASFVAFFPQILSGPIERALNLLPQFSARRSFDYHKAVDGLRQILWGLFKKVVIADTCAMYVNPIFEQSFELSGSTLVTGIVLFSFQIYADFSGYSDIAIGTARLFGINLRQNFAYPNFSRSVAEFWRRWHISLSAWFKDYVYIPLGGSRGNTWTRIRNTFVVFLVSGFWHGANWTFVVWGAINAVYMMPAIIKKTNRKNLHIVAQGKLLPSFRDVLNIVVTFVLITFSRIFFRSDNMLQAVSYIKTIFSASLFEKATITPPVSLMVFIVFFTLIEWIGREQAYALEQFGLKWKRGLRWVFYYVLIILIFAFSGNAQEFIYFQF